MTSYKSNDFVRSTHEPPGALRYESTATRQDTSRPKSSSMNQPHYTHTSSLRTSFSSSSRRYGLDEDDEMDEEDMLESVYNTLSSSSISRDYAQSISRGHSIYSSDDSWKAEGKLSSERSYQSTSVADRAKDYNDLLFVHSERSYQSTSVADRGKDYTDLLKQAVAMHTAASTEANLKNEVQDLKEKLTLMEANLKTQVHYLKDKLTSKEANLQNQVQYLEDMLGSSEDKVKTLTGQLQEEMALSIVVIEAAKEQRAREEQLKDMLGSSEDKAMTLTGQLEQLQAAMDKARKEADEYATRLQEELATSKALLSEAAEELRAREEQLTEAYQRQGEAAQQLKAARQELELLGIRNGNLENDNQHYQERIKLLVKNEDDCRRRTARVVQHYEQRISEFSNANEELSHLNEHLLADEHQSKLRHRNNRVQLVQRALAQGLRQHKKLAISMSWAGWEAAYRRKKLMSTRIRQCLMHWKMRGLSVAWHTWEHAYLRRTKVRRNMYRAILRWKKRALSGAWHKWVEEQYAGRRALACAYKAILHCNKRALCRAWCNWAEVHCRANRVRAFGYKAMMHWQKRALSAAWVTWEDRYRGEKHSRVRQHKCLVYSHKRALCGFWQAWVHQHTTARRHAFLMHKVRCRMRNLGIKQVFGTWLQGMRKGSMTLRQDFACCISETLPSQERTKCTPIAAIGGRGIGEHKEKADQKEADVTGATGEETAADADTQSKILRKIRVLLAFIDNAAVSKQMRMEHTGQWRASLEGKLVSTQQALRKTTETLSTRSKGRAALFAQQVEELEKRMAAAAAWPLPLPSEPEAKSPLQCRIADLEYMETEDMECEDKAGASTFAVHRPSCQSILQYQSPREHSSSLSNSSASSLLMAKIKVGVGAHFRRDDKNMLQIKSLQEGSAAYLCPSIAIGDYIVAINGEAVNGLSQMELAEKLVGPVGSIVECSFKKEACDEVVTVSLHRTIRQPSHVMFSPFSKDQNAVEGQDKRAAEKTENEAMASLDRNKEDSGLEKTKQRCLEFSLSPQAITFAFGASSAVPEKCANYNSMHLSAITKVAALDPVVPSISLPASPGAAEAAANTAETRGRQAAGSGQVHPSLRPLSPAGSASSHCSRSSQQSASRRWSQGMLFKPPATKMPTKELPKDGSLMSNNKGQNPHHDHKHGEDGGEGLLRAKNGELAALARLRVPGSTCSSLSGSSASSQLLAKLKVGVGAHFRRSDDNNMLQIKSLQEGSAAYLCPSIAIGDYIVAINGEAVNGLSQMELAEKLVGPVGSIVECSFKKEACDEVVTVSLHRTITQPPVAPSPKVLSISPLRDQKEV